MLAALRSKIIHAIGVVRLCQNWPFVFLCYFRLIRPREITYVMRNGIKFVVGTYVVEAIGVINSIWLLHTYTPLGDEIEKCATIVDIGANIGSFSVFASTYAEDTKVYSYEPSQENFHFLTENIKLNRLQNIKPYQLAVSGRRGKTRLYIDKKHSTDHSTAIATPGMFSEEVDSVTLQDVLDNNEIESCDLLKMDCEGAEYEILFTAPKSTLAKIRNISLEYHGVPTYHIDNLKRYLENTGFDVWLNGRMPILYARRLEAYEA